jgi:CRP-like cAMP-binding protein
MTTAPPARPDPVDRLLAFLARFVALTEEEQRIVRRLTRIERYPEGTLLLGEGAGARESWLVIEGCVRAFCHVNGRERTVAFHTELHPVTPPTLGTNAPSPLAFVCATDVVAGASTPEEVARGLADHPSFEVTCRLMGEVFLARLQEVHIETVTRTPEQRYRDLVAKRPDLLQRVPQYQIASFLGIQPETLTRIRRRRPARTLGQRD